jgi:protein ImuB
MQRLLRARPGLRDRPVAIAQPGPRGAQVLLCTEAGVHPGMPIAEAKSIVPHLIVQDVDPLRDRLALQKLAAWAERFSPVVGLEEGDAPECLFLDITGCAACFHGEEKLIKRALDEFRAQGRDVRIAVADTLGMAWTQCRPHAPREAVHHAERDGYGDLPVASLRVPSDALQTLTSLGIERIGQLLELPRDHLAQRVDPLVLRRLDQMLGKIAEPIVPCRLPAEVQARCSFEYATDNWQALHHALDHLLDRIVATLNSQQRGARHLECWFFHEAAPPTRADVRLFRPSRSVDHLRKLLNTRLEQVKFAAPVCGICLHAPVVELMAGRQAELFDESPREEELATLIDSLVSRLGREAVTFATLVPDPQPEYACRFDPAVGEPSPARGRLKGERHAKKKASRRTDDAALYSVRSTQYAVPKICSLAPRPSSLASRPEPIDVLTGGVRRLRHAGKEHRIAHWWGPERIQAGWWRGQDVERDYYIVETDAGARWWIFRQLADERWFVHGWFD